MKHLIYLLTIIVMSAVWPCYAGEVYIWTNADGIKQITNTPPPESVKGKGEKLNYRQNTPNEIAEIADYKRKEKAAGDLIGRAYSKMQAQERIRQQNIKSERERRHSAAAQEVAVRNQRNQRADKFESKVEKILQSVRNRGIHLRHEDIDMLEEMAAAKADKIRKGTSTPMSASEDAEFHREEIKRDLLWHNVLKH